MKLAEIFWTVIVLIGMVLPHGAALAGQDRPDDGSTGVGPRTAGDGRAVRTAENPGKGDPPRRKADRKVRLWDVAERNRWRNKPFRSRGNPKVWKQAPYGTTDQKFDNDVVVENDFFYIYFYARYAHAFCAKVDGEPRIWFNALYRRVCGGPYGYRGIKYLKLRKNTPEEIVLEQEGTSHPIPAVFRFFNDKRWIEVTPIDRTKAAQQGIHGKVRMGLAPLEGKNDFVIDSLRDPSGYVDAPATKMLLCFYESGKHPFMWVITWSAPFKEAKPCFNNDSGPKGDTMWWHGQAGCPRSSPGCVTSSWARFGKKGSVVIGGLTHWHNWHRDEVDKHIKKGETYTSKWKPPYPGRWRMTVRLAERRYDQGFKYDGKTKFPAKYFTTDIYDGKFTFTSPADGWIDYVIMYMYDRTKKTPADIQTPMDQYRWTIAQTKRKKAG